MITNLPFHCPVKTENCADLSAFIVTGKTKEVPEIKDAVQKIFQDSTPLERAYWLELLQLYPTFLLRRNGKVVGFANVQPKNGVPDLAAHINLIGVLPEYQHKGYGQILLELAERYGKRIAAKSVSLHTEQRKPRNVAFYSKDGFRVIDVIPSYYGSRGDGVRMEKILTGSIIKPIRKEKNHRAPRKKQGHECTETLKAFPEVVSCENLGDVLPFFSDIRNQINETNSKKELGCLNRMANKISSKCNRNKLVKPTILSMKREINLNVDQRKKLIKKSIL